MGNKSSRGDAATDTSVYEDREKALSALTASRIEVDRQRLNWLLVNCSVEQLQDISKDAKKDLEEAEMNMKEALNLYKTAFNEFKSKQEVIDKRSGANNWDTPKQSDKTALCGEFKKLASLYYKYRKSMYMYEAHQNLDKDVFKYLMEEMKGTETVSESIRKSETKKQKIEQKVRKIQNIPPTVPTYQVGAVLQGKPAILTQPPPSSYNNQIQYRG